MQVDYIIIGQGICGSFLSWELMNRGQKVYVIDEERPFSATKVASGVINPITGRQAAITWMADVIMPFSWQAYEEFGASINSTVIHQKNIIAFPPTADMQISYQKRIDAGIPYLEYTNDTTDYHQWFNYAFKPLEINPVWLIDLLPLLQKWREVLASTESLLPVAFDASALIVTEDGVTYGNIAAKKLIFCNGTGSFIHPFWNKLPFIENKGEAIIAAIPDLPQDNIYKFGKTTIVPWYEGLWWIGSTYEHTFKTAAPTDIFKQQTIKQLQQVLRLPFTIIEHWASLRPAALERRPFVGLHPAIPQVGILNGMGTKGCSLAPYFAKQLADLLLTGSAIDAEADVCRFEKILSLSTT